MNLEHRTKSVKEALYGLVEILGGLRDPARAEVPPETERIPEFCKALLDSMMLVTMLNRQLLARFFSEGFSCDYETSTPWVEKLVFSDSPPALEDQGVENVTETLVGHIGKLSDLLSCLDDEDLARIPPSPQLPEFLALCSAATDQVIWFLSLDLARRMWPGPTGLDD